MNGWRAPPWALAVGVGVSVGLGPMPVVAEPGYPPSSFELRQQEHAERDRARAAVEQQQRLSRQRAFVGQGTADPTPVERITARLGDWLSPTLAVNVAIGATIFAASFSALSDDLGEFASAQRNAVGDDPSGTADTSTATSTATTTATQTQ